MDDGPGDDYKVVRADLLPAMTSSRWLPLRRRRRDRCCRTLEDTRFVGRVSCMDRGVHGGMFLGKNVKLELDFFYFQKIKHGKKVKFWKVKHFVG